jgi:flagellar motor switch protein FliN/FliY
MDMSESKTAVEADSKGNLGVLMDVQLPVAIRFGETEMILEEIVKLGIGSVIELNSGVDQPVELVVNGKTLARGEVVTVDGFYGIRITEITSAGERFKSLSV